MRILKYGTDKHVSVIRYFYLAVNETRDWQETQGNKLNCVRSIVNIDIQARDMNL